MSQQHKRPEDIQAEIDHTRSEMDATLSAIEQRLTPGQLFEQALDFVRHGGAAQFASNLSNSVKQNPLPVTLTSIGLAWLMMSDKQAGRQPHAGATSQKLSEATHAAREKISHATESVRHQAERARGTYEHMRREQPLALGAIGIAIGAALAAALPRTREEDEMMGPARDRLAQRAKETGEQQLEKAKHVVSEARDAAKSEMERQGLTPHESKGGGQREHATAGGGPEEDWAGSRPEQQWRGR